ncbi:ABC transporter permease [Pseudomaricurvus alcaniphilus]|uniref:ABC transporter permease n=1 Tax=Pseudomaricurvus alcaniphilus TaxID=1166482 RepID=UPI00140C87A9|nr:ABC transporter permease [Pseudomaricurvus alcaniphilus]NHN38676.1 ABC transporter permease [Pseudomaricurvus alcaniphilus]
MSEMAGRQSLDLQLSADDLAPLPRSAAVETVVRPSLSYWQGAWRQLRGNTRSMLSLLTILTLLVFCFVTPLFIDFDTSSQDLTQISQSPGLARRSLVVDTAPWGGVAAQYREAAPAAEVFARSRVDDLRLQEAPHTEFVRLAWSALPGAVSYRVYRHILEPSAATDLGLPLGETERRGQVWFEDRLKLKTRTYYYSVVAVSATGAESAYSTLAATPRHAISVLDAGLRGLVDSGDPEVAGTEVDLPRHLLGTDYLGRDLLARLVVGGQTSLFIGLAAPLICAVFAILYGGLSGYLGGRIDELLMRFADFVIALPFLLFMILIRVAMGIGPGQSGVVPLLVALVALGWPSAAKLVRGQVLQLREQPFIAAAQLLGAGPNYLIWRHMLPNVMGVVLVSLTFAIPSAIFTEAFLSFIGMGVAPPTPSWGAMCNDGVASFLSHPHELLLPAAFISVTVLAFNMLGDGLRDALDAKLRD